jgi:hypothetical protein
MATSDFGKAFRAARSSGDKTFTFNGKKYTTDMAKPKTAVKAELGPEMGTAMSASESKDAASNFGYPKGSFRRTSDENTETSDMSMMKRGGKVKKMSSGGSASSRGDGIAQRGKTKGRMV